MQLQRKVSAESSTGGRRLKGSLREKTPAVRGMGDNMPSAEF